MDEQSAFIPEYIAERIRTASDLARSNNAVQTVSPANSVGPHVLTPFHFWPNVIDLTLVHSLDPPLYARIAAEVLARDPRRALLESDWLASIAKGHRLFLARDFVLSVQLGAVSWSEVHYAFVINLDAPSVLELQVHGLEAEGVETCTTPGRMWSATSLRESINSRPERCGASAFEVITGVLSTRLSSLTRL